MEEDVKIKGILLTILAISVALMPIFTGCDSKEPKGEPKIGDGKFQVFGFSTPSGEHITAEQYKKMKESGIDSALALWEDEVPAGTLTQEQFDETDAKKALDAAADAGVKYYVMDKALRNMARKAAVTDRDIAKIESRVALYKDHPGFGGIHLDDEPAENCFESIEKIRAELERLLGKDTDIFVNLFGSRATGTQLSGVASKSISYEDYLASFEEKTNFNRISYDNYPFYYNADDENVDIKMWFENLQQAAQYSSEDKPMNVYIQSCNMDPSKGEGEEDYTQNPYYAQIREKEDITFQLYTAMAFGAQQFSYFTYFDPNSPEIVESPVQADGTTTYLYDFVKQANQELRGFENEFLSYEFIQTIAVPKDGEELSLLTYMLEENMTDVVEFSTTEELIVGEMKNSDGYYAYMIANATEPRDGLSASTTLRFKKGYDKAIVINNGARSVVDIEKGVLTVEVKNGGGVFVMPYYE